MKRLLLAFILMIPISCAYAQTKGGRFVCVKDGASLCGENMIPFAKMKEAAGLYGSSVKYLGKKRNDSIYVEVYFGGQDILRYPLSSSSGKTKEGQRPDDNWVASVMTNEQSDPLRIEYMASTHYDPLPYGLKKDSAKGWMKMADLRPRCPKCKGYPVKENIVRTKTTKCERCDGRGYVDAPF